MTATEFILGRCGPEHIKFTVVDMIHRVALKSANGNWLVLCAQHARALA